MIAALLNPIFDNEKSYITLPPATALILHGYSKLNYLYKALYGLPQSCVIWYKDIDTTLSNKLSYTKYTYKQNLYFGKRVLVRFYVDDILVIDNHPNLPYYTTAETIINVLITKYRKWELRTVSQFIGFEITTTNHNIHLTQHTDIDKIIDRFGMTKYTPTHTSMDRLVNFDNVKCEDKSLDDVMIKKY